MLPAADADENSVTVQLSPWHSPVLVLQSQTSQLATFFCRGTRCSKSRASEIEVFPGGVSWDIIWSLFLQMSTSSNAHVFVSCESGMWLKLLNLQGSHGRATCKWCCEQPVSSLWFFWKFNNLANPFLSVFQLLNYSVMEVPLPFGFTGQRIMRLSSLRAPWMSLFLVPPVSTAVSGASWSDVPCWLHCWADHQPPFPANTGNSIWKTAKPCWRSLSQLTLN